MPQKKEKKQSSGLPAGWTQDDANKYFDEQYENIKRRRTRGGDQGHDIERPVRTNIDYTKAVEPRDYQGDWPYRSHEDVGRIPKNYRPARFNELGVQMNEMSRGEKKRSKGRGRRR